jgi:uroporphyrinogen III methyltransferase/synthase
MQPRPLAGQCILITRAREQSEAFSERLRSWGGVPYLFPVIGFEEPHSWEPLDQAIATIERYRWLVITSPNGARRLAERMAQLGTGFDRLTALRVVAVGRATASVLSKLGRKADLIPAKAKSLAIPEAMRPFLQEGDRVLLVRGDLADPALAQRLVQHGAVVDDRIAYRTVPHEGDAEELRTLLGSRRIAYATFTSGSTLQNLIDRLGGVELLFGTRIACIGPQTSRAAENAGLRVDVVSPEPTMVAFADAIAAHAEVHPW